MAEPRFVKPKKPNRKRTVILFIVLVIVIYLFFNVDRIIEGLFTVK